MQPAGAAVESGAHESDECAPPAEHFRRGDADGNDALQTAHPIQSPGDFSSGRPAPTCLDAADADDSRTVNLSDAVYALNFLFLRGEEPPSLFHDCGIDPWIDGLDCRRYHGCPKGVVRPLAGEATTCEEWPCP